jgi:predicted enzyme related to lactoylglutathione lyase
MPTTTGDTPTGAPVWIDLLTTDQDRAADFYGQLFGWAQEDPSEDGRDFGGYRNFTKDGVRVGGSMVKQPGMEMPDTWTVYLATPDAKETLDLVEPNGGTVLLPVQDVHDLGRFALVQDPGGAAIGLWEPGAHRGFGIVAEPGAPCWFELHARDYDASVPFYEAAFAWPAHVSGDEPGFRYTTYGEGADQRAGVMDASGFLADGAPAQWFVYFGTADCDATVRAAAALGGQVAAPPEDTPYGRLAALVDPMGATFRLLENNVNP